jgi:hypothetical protein
MLIHDIVIKFIEANHNKRHCVVTYNFCTNIENLENWWQVELMPLELYNLMGWEFYKNSKTHRISTIHLKLYLLGKCMNLVALKV